MSYVTNSIVFLTTIGLLYLEIFRAPRKPYVINKLNGKGRKLYFSYNMLCTLLFGNI